MGACCSANTLDLGAVLANRKRERIGILKGEIFCLKYMFLDMQTTRQPLSSRHSD